MSNNNHDIVEFFLYKKNFHWSFAHQCDMVEGKGVCIPLAEVSRKLPHNLGILYQPKSIPKPRFFVTKATQLDFCVTTTQFLFPWNHDQLEPRKTRCCNYLSTSLPVDYQLHQWQHDIPVGKCGFHNEADGHKVEHMKMAWQKNKQESWSGREKLTQVNSLEKNWYRYF